MAVCKKEMGHLAAAKKNIYIYIYNVPRSTLYDNVRSDWHHFQVTQSKVWRTPIIPPALEEKLVESLLTFWRQNFFF
jgi:hypothetical protein